MACVWFAWWQLVAGTSHLPILPAPQVPHGTASPAVAAWLVLPTCTGLPVAVACLMAASTSSTCWGDSSSTHSPCSASALDAVHAVGPVMGLPSWPEPWAAFAAGCTRLLTSPTAMANEGVAEQRAGAEGGGADLSRRRSG